MHLAEISRLRKDAKSNMFDPILEQYLAQLSAAGKSPATRRAIQSDLTQFCTWWERTRQRSFDLTQVVERDLRRT
jgi:site-specific recombinase XerD